MGAQEGGPTPVACDAPRAPAAAPRSGPPRVGAQPQQYGMSPPTTSQRADRGPSGAQGNGAPVAPESLSQEEAFLGPTPRRPQEEGPPDIQETDNPEGESPEGGRPREGGKEGGPQCPREPPAPPARGIPESTRLLEAGHVLAAEAEVYLAHMKRGYELEADSLRARASFLAALEARSD